MEKVIEMSYNPQLRYLKRETVHELNVEKLYDFVKNFMIPLKITQIKIRFYKHTALSLASWTCC